MKLSVIVPIFNVEKYLDKCLDSLNTQIFRDFEVLLINDGSTDNSKNIALKYVEKNDQFKYFEKPNGGLSDARNYGVKFASGDFLAFIDSDDYVDKYMFEKMINKQLESNSEIVVCDMYYEYENGTLKYTKSGDFNLISAKDDLNTININNSACNKIFKKSLFDNILFPVGKWYEDLFTIPIILYRANRISRLPEPMYYYLQRLGSIVHENNLKMFDIYDAIDFIYKTLINEVENKPALIRIINEMYIKHGLFLTTIRIKNNGSFKNRIEFLKINMIQIKTHYPNWHKDVTLGIYPIKSRVIFNLLRCKLFWLVALLMKRE